MTVYIDSDFRCHATYEEGLTPIEDSFFNNKCKEFIENYRFIPEGSVWVNDEGVRFTGQMIAPWADNTGVIETQLNYEMSDAISALEVLRVFE